MKKSSFFSRITGRNEQDDDFFGERVPGESRYEENERTLHLHPTSSSSRPVVEDTSDEDQVGELAVDIYQTADAIIVKAFIAGVQPSSLDIALTREMLTISGTRVDDNEVNEDDYFQRELYWGSFSRTILLPEEVDVDLAEATEKNGVIVIRLPKINKKRQAKLKVKSR